jgi:hypothetical protein
MQNQNGPSDGKPSQQTSALSMGPPSGQPALHLSSMPPATDEIDAEWGEDGAGADTPADGTPEAVSGSSEAAEQPEQPTPEAVSGAEDPSNRAWAMPSSQGSPTSADVSGRPAELSDVPRPPKVRSLRSLQPTLLLFTGGPGPSATQADAAAPAPSAGSEAQTPTPAASAPGSEGSGPELSGGPLASPLTTPVDTSAPQSPEAGAPPSGGPDATAPKAPSAGSTLRSLHPTHIGPWHVPTKAAAAAQTAELSAQGSPVSPSAAGPDWITAQQQRARPAGGPQGVRTPGAVSISDVSDRSVSTRFASNGPVASSLGTPDLLVAPGRGKTAWTIAVPASAALAIAAGYWAFHPETPSATDAAAESATASPAPRAKRVEMPEAKSTPDRPAQPEPAVADEKPAPSTSSPSEASPEPAKDKAAESRAQPSSVPGETVSVKVTVIPSTAILFRGSKRLGEGDATVDVTVGKPVKLVILHRGYYYRRVKIDGSERDVTVRLKKIVPDEAKGDHTSE